MPDNLAAAIVQYLGGVEGLSGVHLDEAPVQPMYPLCIISVIDGIPTITTDNEDYWEAVDVQFTVVATDDAVAKSAGDAAFSAMSTKSGNPKLTFDDGYEMTRFPTRRRFLYRMPNRINDGPYLIASMFQYRFLVARNY